MAPMREQASCIGSQPCRRGRCNNRPASRRALPAEALALLSRSPALVCVPDSTLLLQRPSRACPAGVALRGRTAPGSSHQHQPSPTMVAGSSGIMGLRSAAVDRPCVPVDLFTIIHAVHRCSIAMVEHGRTRAPWLELALAVAAPGPASCSPRSNLSCSGMLAHM